MTNIHYGRTSEKENPSKLIFDTRHVVFPNGTFENNFQYSGYTGYKVESGEYELIRENFGNPNCVKIKLKYGGNRLQLNNHTTIGVIRGGVNVNFSFDIFMKDLGQWFPKVLSSNTHALPTQNTDIPSQQYGRGRNKPIYTLGQISLLRAVSVCTKTTLISSSVGGAGEW